MTNSPQALKFVRPDGGEDLARADLYGVLAELFYAPPTAERLVQIGHAGADGGTPLGAAWNALSAAARATKPDDARDDYEHMFIGVGKPLVYLYGSWYLAGFLMEKPLAALRADLHVLGLERADAVPESEDHIAALCEVMRYLIASDISSAQSRDYGGGSAEDAQRRFFATHIQPWSDRLCDAT